MDPTAFLLHRMGLRLFGLICIYLLTIISIFGDEIEVEVIKSSGNKNSDEKEEDDKEKS